MAASSLDHSDDGKAPNPYFDVDSLTVDSWNNSDFDSPTEYYDDSGDPAEIPGDVNRSEDVADLGTGHVNPISVTATDWDVDEFGEFPRKGEAENMASALDASEWTTNGGSVSDSSTAPGVDGVEVSTTTGTNDDRATYDNFSITTDAEKRYIQLAADVSSASGTPTVQFNDTDGDYVVVELYNATANASADSVLANGTIEGNVIQVQAGSLRVQGSGDGTLNEIQEFTVHGDVTVRFALINLEKTSPYTFGEQYVDSDDDDDLETETIREPHGEFSVHSVDTFDSVFADGEVNGLSYPARLEAAQLSSENVNATFESNDAYPTWDSVPDIYYRMELPDAYDLSYSGVTLAQEQRWPGSRYVSVDVAEGVGDTDFADIDSWNSNAGSFSNQNTVHTLDSTVSVGTTYAVYVQLKLTGDEASPMQQGGGTVPMGDDGGTDWVDFFIGLPGVIAVAATGVVGRLAGKW
jgi:hypothetical protein